MQLLGKVSKMTRRAIYECQSFCKKRCTVRTHGDKPTKCLFDSEQQNWVRTDKHAQKELREYDD